MFIKAVSCKLKTEKWKLLLMQGDKSYVQNCVFLWIPTKKNVKIFMMSFTVISVKLLHVIPSLDCQIICKLCRQISVKLPSAQIFKIVGAKLIEMTIAIVAFEVFQNCIAKLKANVISQ